MLGVTTILASPSLHKNTTPIFFFEKFFQQREVESANAPPFIGRCRHLPQHISVLHHNMAKRGVSLQKKKNSDLFCSVLLFSIFLLYRQSLYYLLGHNDCRCTFFFCAEETRLFRAQKKKSLINERTSYTTYYLHTQKTDTNHG